MPDFYIISGPNGAGKTTAALRIFPRLGVKNFINADLIAQGLSPLDVESAALQSGRIMRGEMERHLAQGSDFALETTLSSRTLAPFVKRCNDAGYRFLLIYLWLNNADLAVHRVAQRVKSGGHNIPEAVIRRRYERGRANFFGLYRNLSDQWLVVENSHLLPVKVAGYQDGETEILQLEIWQLISPEDL